MCIDMKSKISTVFLSVGYFLYFAFLRMGDWVYCQENTKKHEKWNEVIGWSEVGSTAVQKYRGTVTRYFFSTVIGNFRTFSKKYRFWYRRYFFSTFTAVLGTFVWNGIKTI